MEIIFATDGQGRCVYDEAIDLTTLGKLAIQRGSHVEPDEAGQWWADLAPVSGPCLGPFEHRSQALSAEREWLEHEWLQPSTDQAGQRVEHG